MSYWLAYRVIDQDVKQYFGFLWFPIEFPVFVLGIIAYLAWKNYANVINNQGKEIEQGRSLSLLLIMSSAVLYLANLPFSNRGLYLSSFLFLPLILGLAIYPWSLFVNRFTTYVGKISYSVYLVHFFVLNIESYIMNRVDQYPGHYVTSTIIGKPAGLVVIYVMMLGISIPLCTVTWKFVEKPGILVGKKWIARRERNALKIDLVNQ